MEMKGPRPTREETLELIQRRVKGKRQEDGWPDDIKVGYSPPGVSFRSPSETHRKQHLPPALPLQKMTKEQLSCEKTVLQKNLLHYEGLHGRPVSRHLPELWIPSHLFRL